MGSPRFRRRPGSAFGALALALLGGVAACAPADGVVSFAFALAPEEGVELPTEVELGRPIRAFDYAHVEGRCDAVLKSKSVSIKIEGLPPIEAAGAGPYYRFIMLVGPRPIRPQSAPPDDAGQGEAPAEVDLGHVEPDLIGRAEVSLINVSFALDHVTGGRVELVIPASDGTEAVFHIIEGEVGNLPDGVAAPTAPVSGGHQH